MTSAYEKRYERERRAREAAEAMLESKSLELYEANQALQTVNADLERRIADRVRDLENANTRLSEEVEQREQAARTLMITQFAVDRSSDPVFWIDADGRFVYANNAASAALGYTRSELLSSRVFDIDERMSPELWPAHWDELRRRGSFTLESVHRRSDGKTFPVEITVNYLKVDGTELNCAYCRDITARIKKEKKESRLALLHRITEDVARDLLASDNLTASIRHLLSSFGECLDVSRAYLLRVRDQRQMVFGSYQWLADETPPREDHLDEVPASEYGWWISHLAMQRPLVIEDFERETTELPERVGSVLRQTGARALLGLPLIVNDELQGVITFESVGSPRIWLEEEVTTLALAVSSLSRAIERRIAEREREAHRRELTSALERETSANRAKSTFLASMSHELRTPIGAILGYTAMLQSDGRRSPEWPDWLDRTQSSANHLLTLVNDVLDLSKIEAGELSTVASDIRLSDVLQDIEALLQQNATDRGIGLEFTVDEATPEGAHTDPTRLKQILINLVNNAIKFSDGGTVRVTARPQPIRSEPGVEIVVRDNGVGLAPDSLERVFEPFWQDKERTGTRRGGVGLGLAISRRLARILGGDLVARVPSGPGAEFVLTLPVGELTAAPAPATQRNASAEAAGALQGAHILIVDDNPDNQRIIAFILNQAGATTQTAGDGQAGLDAVMQAGNDHTPDLILMDMQMPILDGYGATRQLRARGVTTPIVALTAHAMAEDRTRCLEAGCDDYISKPIDRATFVPTLLQHLGLPTNLASSAQPNRPLAPSSTPAPISPLEEGTRLVYSEMADDPTFAPLLTIYLESLDQARIELATALSHTDWDAVAKRAHKLRGTARNYGYPILSEIAGVCEDAIRNGTPESAAPDRVLREINAILATPRPA